MIKNIITILTFVFCGLVSAQDVILTLDGGNLNYSSDADLAGFQFNHDGCVSGASGGEADAAGFTTSVSGSVVLGFSFTGSTFLPGDALP